MCKNRLFLCICRTGGGDLKPPGCRAGGSVQMGGQKELYLVVLFDRIQVDLSPNRGSAGGFSPSGSKRVEKRVIFGICFCVVLALGRADFFVLVFGCFFEISRGPNPHDYSVRFPKIIRKSKKRAADWWFRPLLKCCET